MLLENKKYTSLKLTLSAVLIFVISAFVFWQHGIDGKMTRDGAIYLYSGQQMGEGVPPFASIFDHKGPVAPLISGVGVFFAKWFHTDDVLTVRITFFILSVLTIVALYVLAHALFSSYGLALLTACSFINFWGFGMYALSGPRAKTPMVLLEILTLWLTIRRQWFWAGVCGALAFLTWQPTLIYPLLALVLAVVQSEGKQKKIRNALSVITGGLVPLLVIGGYFLFEGAFNDFVDGTFLFNITHLERPSTSIFTNIRNMFRAVYLGYTTMAIPIALGFLAILMMSIWRIQKHKTIRSWLSEDRFAILLLSFPIPFIWSVMDFQDYPDFFVFLPYAAIGFGWLLYTTVQNLEKAFEIPKMAARGFIFVTCVVLIGAAAVNYKTTATEELNAQKAWADEVVRRFGDDVKIASIGVPEALVLLHKTNPNPYAFIIYGIDNRIHAKSEGGFDGWLEQLKAYNPMLVFFGVTHGKHIPKLEVWLAESYNKSSIGEWEVFIHKAVPDRYLP